MYFFYICQKVCNLFFTLVVSWFEHLVYIMQNFNVTVFTFISFSLIERERETASYKIKIVNLFQYFVVNTNSASWLFPSWFPIFLDEIVFTNAIHVSGIRGDRRSFRHFRTEILADASIQGWDHIWIRGWVRVTHSLTSERTLCDLLP